jgi:hypothetical protein
MMTKEDGRYRLDKLFVDRIWGYVYEEHDPDAINCSKCRQPLRGLEGFVWIAGELYHRECAGWTP